MNLTDWSRVYKIRKKLSAHASIRWPILFQPRFTRSIPQDTSLLYRNHCLPCWETTVVHRVGAWVGRLQKVRNPTRSVTAHEDSTPLIPEFPHWIQLHASSIHLPQFKPFIRGRIYDLSANLPSHSWSSKPVTVSALCTHSRLVHPSYMYESSSSPPFNCDNNIRKPFCI
jgi:hypothetical protein